MQNSISLTQHIQIDLHWTSPQGYSQIKIDTFSALLGFTCRCQGIIPELTLAVQVLTRKSSWCYRKIYCRKQFKLRSDHHGKDKQLSEVEKVTIFWCKDMCKTHNTLSTKVSQEKSMQNLVHLQRQRFDMVFSTHPQRKKAWVYCRYLCTRWSTKNNQLTSWKTNKKLKFRTLRPAMNEPN